MQKLFYGGDIITMVNETDAPEAVLIQDGKITFTGSKKEAELRLDPEAEKVDLKGKTLMPSFIDPHSHISLYSQFASFLDLSECRNFQEIIDALKKCIKDHSIDETGILMATGYDHNFLEEEAHPDCRVLDAASETIPICLIHSSGHMVTVNSALLSLAGITRDTPEPEGGHIGRYEDGRPNGYFEELGATCKVLMTVFARLKMDAEKQMEDVQNIYLQYGITTAQDGSSNEESLKAFWNMASKGVFKIDIVAYPLSEEKGITEILENYKEAAGTYFHHFKIGGGKVILDGSPQGKTAWLSKPYENETELCGYPSHSDEFVEAVAEAAISGEYQLLAHCNGDAASEQFLRCYQKALEKVGEKKDLRPVMIHCQTIRDDQLDKMKKLSMIPSMFVAHTYFWGDVHLKNLGWERACRISPAKSALKRGLPYNFHQDSPVLKPDMMRTVWCAVNRVTRKGKLLGEEQCISVYDALKGITIHAAYAYHEEQQKGTIEAGKLADLVILEKNPLKTDKSLLKDIAVEETIKEGETLYRRGKDTL